MKIKMISTALSALVMALGISFVSTSVVADHGLMQHAGNSCFPRVFSQIDQFKMSSGGLRNTNANERSIVCSLDLNNLDGASPIDTVDLYMNFETLPAPMECTAYTRTGGDGTLLDSLTITWPMGSNGINQFLGTLDFSMSGFQHWQVNHYIQCKVPGNGRIFGTRSYYNYPPT